MFFWDFHVYFQYATLEWVREQRGHGRGRPQLFDYTLVVGLEKVADHNHYKPKIIFKFPDQVRNVRCLIIRHIAYKDKP